MPGGFVVGDFLLTFPISALEQHQPDGIITSQWPPLECPSPPGLDARVRVGFAAYRSLTPPWPMPATTRMLSGACNLLMGVALGTLLTGAGAVAYRRGRGDRSYPSLPGHWLYRSASPPHWPTPWPSSCTDSCSRPGSLPTPTVSLLVSLPPGPERPGPPRDGPSVCRMGLGTVIALMFLWSLRRELNRAWLAVFFTFFLAAGVLSVGAIVTTIGAFGPSGGSGTPRVVSSCNPSLRRIHPPVYRHDAGPPCSISSPGPRPTVCTGPESWRG